MTTLDPQVIARRLATMRMLLDHLGRLEITVPEQLEALAVRLQVERILSQLVDLTMVTQAVPRALSGYGDYVRQVAAALDRTR